MFTEDFYSYDIRSNGKRVAYNLDSEPRMVGKYAGFDIMDLLMEMREQGLEEVTLTITLRRYPEDEAIECSETEEGC